MVTAMAIGAAIVAAGIITDGTVDAAIGGTIIAIGEHMRLRRAHPRRCARHQMPNAITTAPASVNQVMAYCR